MANPAAPAHVAIIMDGNGRWAKKRGLPRVMGHREGVKQVRPVVLHASNAGAKCLSLFAFSTENWLRPKTEVETLMKLLDEYIDRQLGEILENNVRLVVSGRLEKIPDSTRAKIDASVERSRNNSGMILNLALNYGGRQELVDAAARLAGKVASGEMTPGAIDEEAFSSCLYAPELPDIDLLIRTSGELRISNFMLWRAAYAELFFTDTLWPDFGAGELDAAFADYAHRRRRFGKTDEQLKA